MRMVRSIIHVAFMAAFAFGIQLQCGVWCVDPPAPSCHEEKLPASHTCIHPEFVNDAGTVNPQKAGVSGMKAAAVPLSFAVPQPPPSSTAVMDRLPEVQEPVVLPVRPLRI
jgi:hypothetical protein